VCSGEGEDDEEGVPAGEAGWGGARGGGRRGHEEEDD